MALLVIAVNFTPVQNYIARQSAKWLADKLGTRVEIKHVRIDFLNHMALQGLLIEDKTHDTLLYSGEATVKISDWFVFKDKPVMHYLALSNTYIHLYRTRASNEWNYDFIEKVFATNNTPNANDTGKQFEFDLEQVKMDQVWLHFDDAWGGEDLDFDFGKLSLDADQLNFKKKRLDIDKINIENLVVGINEYTGGKPRRILPKNYVEPVDTTPFNPDNWMFTVKTLDLVNCELRLIGSNKPAPVGLFDEDHLIIKQIDAAIKNASVVGDTIRGQTLHLHAKERCGIEIKTMQAMVSVSPVASICDQLYLETNYSKLHDYYAMHYKRFPNFLEYLDSVVMVGNLNNAKVDTRDIAFFAPEMKALPGIVHITGSGKGTVANLAGKATSVSDGHSVLKGEFTMKGLPDIYTTYITLKNAELYTNGAGIFQHAPSLRNATEVNLAAITHAYFKGNYSGYIDNFNVNGVLTTNLGSVAANVKMSIPRFNGAAATYSGKIATDKLELGILFNQPILGGLSCEEDFNGHSFNADNAAVKIDGNINQLVINQYPYQKISTHGTLSKKQFNGNLLVDDPNLALEFDGGLDYNEKKNIKINATAHLLFSDLRALNITKDSFTTSADFDLNSTGSNIDNFNGYARLYNIDLKRNNRKVAVDSVALIATDLSNNQKRLSVQSNILSAAITGEYQLSKLPSSFQYYLSRYIPNYIKEPDVAATGQIIDFTIKTRNVDSLLAVSYPLLTGFNNSTVTGNFNTNAQKLQLNADIPFGTIGRFHMHEVTINAQGNLEQIALGTNIENVIIGDSLVNSSLSLTTTLAHDSLNFTVATTTPDTSSAITINGHILARKDSLFLSVLPSEFYLNRARWEIAGGSSVTYTTDYLNIENIMLNSGFQKVTVNSHLNYNDNGIVVNTENLDLGQFGYWTGLSEYQPDGRLNGTISIERIFKGFYVGANMKATNVKFGSDTVGTINLVGAYDGIRNVLSFDPLTGIYRDNSSVTASGNISFEASTNQQLDGNIEFNNARVEWASPFLTGIFSKLGGTLNGSVKFRGTSYAPVIDGTVGLLNGALHLDYMGCNYTIPAASVKITNNRISWGKAEIFDAYNNHGYVSGYFSHNLFRDMAMRITVTTPKMEVMRLTASDNNMFYGNLIASMDSFTVRGPFNFIKLHAYNVAPAAKSHLYIPVSTAAEISTYSYVSFKTYGKKQEKPHHVAPYKLDLAIDASVNQLADITIVLDPTTGDAITARGDGDIQLSIPPGNDMRITGLYTINEGTYDFTFKQLEYHRQFQLNQGSTISFTGPFFETEMRVNATYSRRARLYDLLNETEISRLDNLELTDSKTPQTVNVLMNMSGTLNVPKLTFSLDLPEKRSVGTYAYTKLMRTNQDDRQLYSQVGSFLLINSFIPSDGLGSSAVGKNVGLNNMGQLLSSGVSTGLTSLVNKLTGDDKLNIDVKYNNYSFSDQVAQNSYNRNQVKIGLSRPFLNDKLIVEVGSTSDWGKPVSTTNSSNFNITGDFRIQYILPQTNGIRLNAFRTSDYDVTLDKDITRGGVGISFRKSFDGLYDLFHNPGKTLPLPPKISEPSDSGEKREKARGGTQ